MPAVLSCTRMGGTAGATSLASGTSNRPSARAAVLADHASFFRPESRRRLDWLLANAPVHFAVHATLTYHARG